MTSRPAEIETALQQLPPTLLNALLPLALEKTWHPVRSLSVAPDLPDVWWDQVQTHLPLVVQENGTIPVPSELREALTQRLSITFPRRYRELIQQHSAEALRDDNISLAASLLNDIGDQEGLNAVLEKWISEHHHIGNHERIELELKSIPSAWLGARAQAAYWLSQIVSGREMAIEARQQVQQAYDRGDRNPRLMQAFSFALHSEGQYQLALQVARQALATDIAGIDQLRILHLKAISLDCLSQDVEHLEAAQELLDQATAHVDLRYMGLAHVTLACAYENLSDWATAEPHYQQAITLYNRTSQWRFLATLLNNYAQALGDRGRVTEALQHLQDAERLSHISPRHQAWLAMSKATIHHRYGMHVDALASTRQAVLLLRQLQLPADEVMALSSVAERLVFNQQIEAAEQVHREARALLGTDPDGEAQLAFTAGVITFAKQEWLTAEKQFREALSGSLFNWNEARAHIYLVALALKAGKTPDTEVLRTKLDAFGQDTPLLTDASLLTETLTWLRQQPEWRERVEQVFGHQMIGTVPLRLELLGPLEIYHQERLLRFPLRRSAELLAFLALQGASTRQQLMAALWEEQADKKVVDLFKKTLRGLRETLRPLLPEGADPIVIEGGQHQLHPLLALTTSWLARDLFLAPAVHIRGPLEIRGPFLADAQGPWADDARREIHERLYQDLTERLENGDPTVQQAVQLLRTLV
ncbi:tetratricopeptide repeat protein [Deinococcus sp. HMF7620]|uniref:Tetratricopeptide repeat protein n=1 Tax=Deinococcus arboris TaxID=2682977 RepID=A0A7C9HPX0_9DEIO|nr:tetratricopeptide repeat protein [Deinococcus arboris]MVN85689.1 tetratricopeptide repeat protein [Deinococcus arboris]